MIRRKSTKNMSFQQLCEAIEKGEEATIAGLEAFAPAEEPETEPEAAETDGLVTVTFDPNAPMSEILHIIAEAIEDAAGEPAPAEETEPADDDDDDNEIVIDDTEPAEEQEENVEGGAYAAEVDARTVRRRLNTAITRKPTVDTDLQVNSGEAKPANYDAKATRKRLGKTAQNRTGKVEDTTLGANAKGKRITDVK